MTRRITTVLSHADIVAALAQYVVNKRDLPTGTVGKIDLDLFFKHPMPVGNELQQVRIEFDHTPQEPE